MEQTTKRCTRCGDELPATTEYFYKRGGKRAGLRGACKSCHIEQAKATRDPARAAAYQREWARSNREKRRKANRDWRARNLEAQRARERAVKRNDSNHAAKARAWEASNPSRHRAQRLRYARSNRGKLRAILHRYIARKASLPDDFTTDDWRFALDYFGNCCAVCGRRPGDDCTLAMDHWQPLSGPDCPGTVPHNIVPLCHGQNGCNNSKHDRQPEEWLHHVYGGREARAIIRKIHAFFSAVRQT